MPSSSSRDKSFEGVRFKASIGLFVFSLLFTVVTVVLLHQHATEQQRLGQVLADNRQLLENQKLLKGAVQQMEANLKRQNQRLETKTQALASSEQIRLELQQQRREQLRKRQEQQATLERIRTQLAPVLEDTDAQIFLGEDHATIRLPGARLFAPAEATLQPDGQNILLSVAEILRTELEPFPIRVEGHTDNVPIGQNLQAVFSSNWHLSAARASAATMFLIEKGQIRPARLEAVGKGANAPVADNATEEGRARNRRLDIVIDIRDVL